MRRVVRKHNVRNLVAGNIVKIHDKFRVIESVVHTRVPGAVMTTVCYKENKALRGHTFQKNELVERQRQK